MAKIIDVEQGSAEWHKWRLSGIGGSDASIIASYFLPADCDWPYTTSWAGAELYKLWSLKTGRTPFKEQKDRSTDTYVDPLAHGHREEEKARLWYNATFGQLTEAVCVQHWTVPHLIASLDGHREGECIIEFKCPKEPDMHRKAKEGEVPQQYWAQLMHNMVATGETRAEFVSFYKGEGVVIPVEADSKLIDKLREAEEIFWSWVTEKKFGGLPIGGEVNEVTPEWAKLVDAYFENQRKMRELEVVERRLKREIHHRMKATKVVGGGAQASISVRPPQVVPPFQRSEFLLLQIEKV
jgi:putative phage-type endonuclease